MSELPDPLVPAEVDLRDFAFMPLDVRRLRDSRLVATRTAEESLAAILLWSASWHQVPASSLPDDEIELSQLSGYGGRRALREYRRIKEGSLYGFILCSDNRWYHRVVAEKAADGWNGKLKEEHKRACDRRRKENKEREARKEPVLLMPPSPLLLSLLEFDGIPRWRYWDSDGRELNSAGIPQDGLRKSRLKGEVQGQGEGQCKGKGITPVSSLRSETSDGKSASAGATPAATAETWNAYSDAYRQRHGVEPVRNAKVNGMLAGLLRRLPIAEAPRVAAFYVSHNRQLYVAAKHPVDLLLRDAEGLRTEWATGRAGTETEARQADRTQATGNAFAPLLAEARERKASGSE